MEKKATMYGPAIYELRVQGRLDTSWMEMVEVDTISTVESQDQGAVTVIIASFQDQAALRGLLDRLYRRNLPLISVRHINNNSIG